ncbi:MULTISPECIES: hypothetical protein [unclassified Streptomyces]|uniref:ATP dependent DNA ligase n=1 Tax=unclassified Streptomyces TaxID=2593676 RepID=UPI000B88CDC1
MLNLPHVRNCGKPVTELTGSRIGFGALLLGYHADDGALRYAGKAGTGFSQHRLGAGSHQLTGDTIASRRRDTRVAVTPLDRARAPSLGATKEADLMNADRRVALFDMNGTLVDSTSSGEPRRHRQEITTSAKRQNHFASWRWLWRGRQTGARYPANRRVPPSPDCPGARVLYGV